MIIIDTSDKIFLYRWNGKGYLVKEQLAIDCLFVVYKILVKNFIMVHILHINFEKNYWYLLCKSAKIYSVRSTIKKSSNKFLEKGH